jgi:Mn-dependent DtxR family transcriptional regulator
MKKGDNLLSASMEDYLEMIYRLSKNKGYTRIHELSSALNVQPPSATRMVQRLGELGLLQYEKYGLILLKKDGKKLGEILLKQHNIIEGLLKILGLKKENILTETEKVEHTLSDETINHFDKFISFMKENPDILAKYNNYTQLNGTKNNHISLKNIQ